MGLRLSQDDHERFVDEYQRPPMEQYGRVMKEYVVVPDRLLVNPEGLLVYLQKSYEYVSSLESQADKEVS